MEKALYDTYLAILKEELVPAMGCTEPIAVAYAAALAARALGCPAEQAEVAASANIIKNVKSVVVPHTGGRRGIAAADRKSTRLNSSHSRKSRMPSSA